MRAALALTVILLCATDAFILSSQIARADSGGSGSQAGLVIEHGDGTIDTYCVGFSGDSITGDQLLSKAGIGVVQFNGAVCAVGNQEGCFQPHDFASCYCDSFPPKNTYWSFFTASPGQPWVYSAAGFTTAKARDGDLQAWRWGVGGPNSAAPPPQIAFDQVCTDRAVQPATPTAVQPTAPPPPAATTQPQPNSPASAPTPVPPGAASPPAPASQQSSPAATVSSTLTAPSAAAPPGTTSRPITNHGTATAVPQAPATGTTSTGSSGLAGLAAFIAIAAVLAVTTIFAVLWRRRRGA